MEEVSAELALVSKRATSVELPVSIAAEFTTSTVPRRVESSQQLSRAAAASVAVAGLESTRPVSFAGNPPPRSPPLALARGWHGKVLLRIDIDPQGRIVAVAVQASSGYDVLDAAALEAVRRWRASPSVRGGKAVASTELQPIIFRPRR